MMNPESAELFKDCKSERFRKNVPVRFSRGFGCSPNPGIASDSKPSGVGGGGVCWAGYMAQPMTYQVACWGPAVKSRREGRVSCTDTST